MHWIWSIAEVLTARRLRVRYGRTPKRLYLTFDDGPHPLITPQILDALKQTGAKATFFLLGDHARAHPELVRRIQAEGHAIGNHSMSHPNFRKMSARAQLAEIGNADAVLSAFDRRPRHAFRPPRGNTTLTVIFNALLRAQPVVLWSFDSEDYRLVDQALLTRLTAYQPTAGDILLFHDDMPSTIQALLTMIPRWRDAGYQFGTTDDGHASRS